MTHPTFSEITFKASHNSYDKEENVPQQLSCNNETYNFGCMALEFDIWRHSSKYTPGEKIDAGYFTIGHSKPGETTLAHYLKELLDWHDEKPDHDVILITLDIKSGFGGYDAFHEEIDTYLKLHFEENLIFKPFQLIQDPHVSLCQNVINHGWPELSSDELTGKFIFCLSGNTAWKSKYANTDLIHRFCFCDEDKKDWDPAVRPPKEGNIVFFNFHIHKSFKKVWMKTIPLFTQLDLITRTYVSNSEENWKNCIEATVSAIATDLICDNTWSKVSNTGAYRIKDESKKPDVDPEQDPKKEQTQYSLKNQANNQYRTDHATKMCDTFSAPNCAFIFERQINQTDIYAIKNAKNNEYLDCTISSMSTTVKDDCQRWKLIPKKLNDSEFYVQNLKNGKYLTKKASQLSSKADDNEVYIIKPIN